MKVLITGVNGFLGYYFIEKLIANGHHVIATGKGENKLPFTSSYFVYETMDFTDAAVVNNIFQQHHPGYIIHAGAVSKPDECEKNKPLADKINIEGTAILLAAAKKICCRLFIFKYRFCF